MKRRPRRELRPEEKELWNQVRKNTVPLRLDGPHVVTPGPDDGSSGKKAANVWRPPEFSIGEKSAATRPQISQFTQAAQPSINMDSKRFSRMKKGKLRPEARLDLHGMTLAQAQPALSSFIFEAHAKGLRLVLVITGKGRARDDGNPVPVRTGALRHHVPQWLKSAPLGPLVLQVNEAHVRHGGGGAVYVYLRRRL